MGNTTLDHTMNYTYLGLQITASRNFCTAVNALNDKARRALCAIKQKFYNIKYPNQNLCKMFDSVIRPIALYGSEVWGPLSHQNYNRWEKHPIETLHAEFCRNILYIQRKSPTNVCRAELGRLTLIIDTQKRALNFLMHLRSSPPDSLQFKALERVP